MGGFCDLFIMGDSVYIGETVKMSLGDVILLIMCLVLTARYFVEWYYS